VHGRRGVSHLCVRAGAFRSRGALGAPRNRFAFPSSGRFDRRTRHNKCLALVKSPTVVSLTAAPWCPLAHASLRCQPSPADTRGKFVSADTPKGFPLARGARSAPLGKGFAIPSPTFPGITAEVALGVRDSRPLLPAVARPTSPSIHRATPAAPRLLVFRRWVKILPYMTANPWEKDREWNVLLLHLAHKQAACQRMLHPYN